MNAELGYGAIEILDDIGLKASELQQQLQKKSQTNISWHGMTENMSIASHSKTYSFFSINLFKI